MSTTPVNEGYVQPVLSESCGFAFSAPVVPDKLVIVEPDYDQNEDRSPRNFVNNSESDPLIPLKRRALEFKPLFGLEIEIYVSLAELLNEEKDEATNRGHYKKADRYKKALENVAFYKVEQQKLNAQKEAIKRLEEDVAFVRGDLEAFDQETKALQKELNQYQRSRKRELFQKFNQGLDEHDSHWASEPKMRQYSHASPDLIQMKRALRLLIKQDRLEEASSYQDEINKRQKVEEEQNHRQMQLDYDESLAKLKKKQALSLAVFENKCKAQQSQFRHERSKLRSEFETRINAVEKRRATVMDPNKNWNTLAAQRIEEISLGISPRSISSRKIATLMLKRPGDALLSLPPLEKKTKKYIVSTEAQAEP